MKINNNSTASFWQNKYENLSTKWDLGTISLPLKTYFDQIKDKELELLIPGCGNAYEVEYLFNAGYKNIDLLDIAEAPLINFKNRVPKFPDNHIIQSDFFKHKGQYDLIIEQTFFCALQPHLREKYVQKMHNLLKSKGQLIGLLFDFPLTELGPPYGGDINSYQQLFCNLFKIKVLERSFNSHPDRFGKELFIIFEKI
jgi:thiopurine S-methyltransferase